MVIVDGSLASATYWSFSIGSEESKYRLTVSGYDGVSGGDVLDKDAGNTKWVANGQPFSTWDRDYDQCASCNCAITMGGGWWYNGCTNSVLNRDINGEWMAINAIQSSKMAVCRI